MTGCNRSDVINTLIRRAGYRTYLEIGVQDNAYTFDRITAPHKDGVDPVRGGNIRMTSDAFFAHLRAGFFYDIIFIDGLHRWEQVLNDIHNSLNHLSPGGAIVLHDLNPAEYHHQIRSPLDGGVWNGDCWKAVLMLRMNRSDLHLRTVDTDYGCGVLTRGSQEPFVPPPDVDLAQFFHTHDPTPREFQFFQEHKKEILNLVSPDEFFVNSRTTAQEPVPAASDGPANRAPERQAGNSARVGPDK